MSGVRCKKIKDSQTMRLKILFENFGVDTRLHVWKTAGIALHQANNTPTVTHGGGSVMV